MDRHPGTFKIRCRPCDAPRVVLPTNILVCVACDRAVKEGVVVGPVNLDKAKDAPSFRLGRSAAVWDVRTDRI